MLQKKIKKYCWWTSEEKTCYISTLLIDRMGITISMKVFPTWVHCPTHIHTQSQNNYGSIMVFGMLLVGLQLSCWCSQNFIEVLDHSRSRDLCIYCTHERLIAIPPGIAVQFHVTINLGSPLLILKLVSSVVNSHTTQLMQIF